MIVFQKKSNRWFTYVNKIYSSILKIENGEYSLLYWLNV